MTVDEAVDIALPYYRFRRLHGRNGLEKIAKEVGVTVVTLWRRCNQRLDEEAAATQAMDEEVSA